MLCHKKGILPFLTLPFLVVAGIILVIALIALGGFAFFLTANILTLIGAFLVVISGLMAFNGNVGRLTLIMLIIGIVLITVPRITDFASSFSLATVII